MIEAILLSFLLFFIYTQQRAWVIILILSANYFFRYRKSFVKIIIIFSITIICLFRVGMLQNEEFVSFSFIDEKCVAITGIVKEDSKLASWGQKRCVIKLLEANLKNGDVATCKGRIGVNYIGPSLFYGDVVSFSGKLKNSSFNAKNYTLLNRSNLNRTRSKIFEKFSSISSRELSTMLLLGYTPSNDSELTTLARNSGNSHILALSGMHLALFSSLITFVLTPIFTKKYAKIISLSLLTLYILFIGPKPSLIRAYILSLTFILFKFDKNIDALVFCFVIQLLFFKDSIMTISTMLSYISLCGIMTLPKFLLDSIDSFIVLPEVLIMPFLVTIGALIFTIPVSYYLFGTYQVSSIITSPIAGVLIYIYMVISIVSLFNSKALIILDKIYIVLEYVLRKGSEIKLQENLNVYFILLFFTLLIIALGRLKRKNK